MKKWILVAALALAGCNKMSDDSFGVYGDGDFYIVANHHRQKINFTNTAHPTPDALLQEIENGKGIGFKTWRDASSCGLTDDLGNSFVVPRGVSRLVRKGLTYQVVAPDPIYQKVNDGTPPHQEGVKVTAADGTVIMAYVFDDTAGIRSIDRYTDGKLDRTIVLQQGVGMLAHCRGFSLDDQSWYNNLNGKNSYLAD
ncbi:MAG: hypothetical protein WDN06_00830 [Asticcacaulis sp.]